jgi:hypothetical protein
METSPISLPQVQELMVACNVLVTVIENFNYVEGEELKEYDEKILSAAMLKADAMLR